MFKGIVFDLDGTLVDSLAVTFDAFNHAITLFGGRRHSPEEILKHFGPGEEEIFAKILGPHQASAAYQANRMYLDTHMTQVPLHPGITELLDHCLSQNIPISIFTGRSWETTELILKHHGILGRFVTVIANDHVTSPKPSPEGLHMAVERMKLQPSELLFVGDSPVDMMASRSAGTVGVAALWDLLAMRSALEMHRPQYFAHHPREILEIVKTPALSPGSYSE